MGGISFFISLAIYLLIRLVALSDYPIYFFTDEAIQANLAADFLRDNFRNYDGELFPTYFQNIDKYSLSISVYAQVLPVLIFGKSVFVTRAVSVVISLLAAWSLGMILKNIFKLPYWWSGPLLLSAAPAWFLHSRTAFETALMVPFYAGALYFYLQYRHNKPAQLYIAILFGALAFYAYNPGRVVIAATGFLLLLSDLRYHWRQRRTVLIALLLAALTMLPYVRFQVAHPGSNLEQLRQLASYWVQNIPLSEKLSTFASEYLTGLNPFYWFMPTDRDLPRHQMDGLGNLFPFTLPFALVGLFICLRKLRSPAHRVVLIALVAAPSGAALVHMGVTRALVFVLPATLLTAFGWDAGLRWLERRGLPRSIVSPASLALLSFVNIALLLAALVYGPTWERDYDLGGMQYGARQVFSAVKDYRQANPETQLIVSPTWTNGADVLARFFFPDDEDQPFILDGPNTYLNNYIPAIEIDSVFIVPAREYALILSSNKYKTIQVEDILPYPDGNPGFYFLRLEYVDEIVDILVSEQEARRVLLTEQVEIAGQTVDVKHSQLDMGAVDFWFDDDPYTVGRSLEANPLVIELGFPEIREFSSLHMVTGSAKVEINLRFFEEKQSTSTEYTFTYQGSINEPGQSFSFPPTETRRLRLEVTDLTQGEPGNVHVWEIDFH